MCAAMQSPQRDEMDGQAGGPQSMPPEEQAPQREPVFNLAPVVVALIAVCVAVHIVLMFVLDDATANWVFARTAFVPLFYSGQFELDVFTFTAPLTYSLLHASIAHIAINMIWLAAFGSPLAHRLGTVAFLLFWAVTAIAAAALHYALHPYDPTPLVGASGAISGMMGAAARFGFRISRIDGKPAFAGPVLPVSVVLRLRPVITFLAVWMAINLVTGLVGLGAGEDSIAWEAHIGGFVAGFFGVGYFVPGRRRAAGAPTE